MAPGPVAFRLNWQLEEVVEAAASVQLVGVQSPVVCPGRGVQDALTVPVGTVVSVTATMQSDFVRLTWTVLGLQVNDVCVL